MSLKEKDAQLALESGYAEATATLEDADKLEEFLQKLEQKLKVIPLVGDKLSNVPAMASLLRSYAKKEYTNIPVKSIVAITSALIYLVSPIDLIPDHIPVIGYIDDATVIDICWNMVADDVAAYNEWRASTGRLADN